jgi:5S rRNA maturation endonuclease (ribonuclease M5)
VSPEPLRRLGVGWNANEGCWTFPLSDADRQVVGINRRFGNGRKMVMPGHRAGLYLPCDLPTSLSGETLLICEGGSDTAAALDLNFIAVGRFNCMASVMLLVDLVRRTRPDAVVIIADADATGRRGAQDLAAAIKPRVIVCKIVEPPAPHKDLRAWLVAGASRQDVLEAVRTASAMALRIEVVHAR